MHVSPQGRKGCGCLNTVREWYARSIGPEASQGKLKGVQNFSVQDASAALPQNCQTTIRILGCGGRGVNITSVIGAGLTGNPVASAGRNHDE